MSAALNERQKALLVDVWGEVKGQESDLSTGSSFVFDGPQIGVGRAGTNKV